ncbi:DNA processing protein DprA [Methylococcaceae bacterium CS1]|nr:DNA processing protein DprA [Methylococcaceae bacterium CS4]TXK94335.1 DNA processing protein DprA [Methylococcaceae bacterium CS5]TXL02776.1 DNA processing protein DprA [Methylococcaceae bacterium CS1]TXL03509.1 DNA processing protein DprA [Methylococcaceae bacterium CS3]TXL06096.1 DNA processing protein DprA [Methylococcaceae bacterium CS2]
MDLSQADNQFFKQVVSPYREMAAYETLWEKKTATYKRIADMFRERPGAMPSDLVEPEAVEKIMKTLDDIFDKYHLDKFGVRVRGANEYPESLRDAKNPLEVLYYQGLWGLVNTSSVAIVGAREVSIEGIRRTRKLVRCLVEDEFTIVSGLAEGVDTTAHTTALEMNGRTIAVIGTPLTHIYPKNNLELQGIIKENHLLISQVPFKRYLDQDYRSNRSFFPERNITMAALTQATVIVEASDTSGTLYQARAALAQGRKLFILDSCFKNPHITWPERFSKKGAIRVREYEDIKEHLDHV